jgi:hypothetical protein
VTYEKVVIIHVFAAVVKMRMNAHSVLVELVYFPKGVGYKSTVGGSLAECPGGGTRKRAQDSKEKAGFIHLARRGCVRVGGSSTNQ